MQAACVCFSGIGHSILSSALASHSRRAATSLIIVCLLISAVFSYKHSSEWNKYIIQFPKEFISAARLKMTHCGDNFAAARGDFDADYLHALDFINFH